MDYKTVSDAVPCILQHFNVQIQQVNGSLTLQL